MDVRKIVKSLIVDSENKILLLQRSDYKGPSSQHFWDLPGGSVDKNEDILSAIKRECREELTLDLKNFKLLSNHSGQYSESNFFEFYLYVCDVANMELNILLSHEHVDFKWVCLEDLYLYKTKSEKRTIDVIVNFLKKRILDMN